MTATSSGESDPEGELRYHDDIRIPVGSGTVAATRIEPTAYEGPLPAILMSFPYHKDDYGMFGKYVPSLEYFAKQGYEVVAADLPGTGASSGRKETPFTADEGPQTAAMVEWVAEQDWTNGKVGMYGKSWGGQTQVRAAAEEPDGLEAIVPIMPAIDLYEDVAYTGGVMESYKAACGFPIWYQTLQAMPPTNRDTDGQWAELWDEKLTELKEGTPWLFQLLDHDTKDEYWQAKEIPTDNIDVPMLMIAGYRDLHPVSDIECFHSATGPKRMLLGPWRHQMPHRGREIAIDFREQVVEWFDEYLKGEDTRVDDRPAISYWTERNGGSKVETGVWRGRDEWPDTESAEGTLGFALTDSGLESADEFDDGSVEAEYEFDHTVGIHSQDYLTGKPVDPAEDNTRSLVFESEALVDAVEFTGTGEATINIRAETPDPTVAVRVLDIGPGGNSSVVSYGYLNASHRTGHEVPEPLSVGEECEVTIRLRPRSHVFEPGHRIGVTVSASLFPMTFPTRDHGSFTVLSSPENASGIEFPGTYHTEAPTFDEGYQMPQPDGSTVPLTSPYLSESNSEWETARVHTGDAARFETAEKIAVELPHGPTLRWSQSARATTSDREPTQTAVVATVTADVVFENEVTTVETTGRITHDTAQLSTVVETDGQTVFDEQWSRQGE